MLKMMSLIGVLMLAGIAISKQYFDRGIWRTA